MPILRKTEALQFLERHAAVLDAPANPPNPYGTSAWLLHYVEQVVPAEATLLLPMVEGDGASLMPLGFDDAHPRRAVPLANFYTSLFSPVASSAGDRPAAIHALVAELGRLRPKLASVQFAPLDADGLDTLELERTLGASGWYVRRYQSFGNCYLPCEGMDFATYLAGRDSKLRNTYERRAKKLLAEGSVRIATTVDEVDAAMDAYEAIYAKSWKRPEPYPAFTRGWARRCAERGWLRLGVARVGETPVAAQLWYVHERRAYIYKLAYDEAFSKWSAGTVLSAELMRHVLETDRVVEVDFLSGDDPYKRTWMSHHRPRIGLMACNLRSPEGLVLALKEFAGQATARLRVREEAAPAWSRSRGPAE